MRQPFAENTVARARRLWVSVRGYLRAEAAWLRVYAVEVVILLLIGSLCTASYYYRAGTKSEIADLLARRDVMVPRWPVHDPVTAANLLIEAIIQVESAGHPRKVGRAGERGLMQIKPGTWRDLTRRMYGAVLPFDRAFDPDMNVRVGRAYLAELQHFLLAHRDKWRSDERELLLACYNIGPNRVRRAGFDVRRLPVRVRDYVERATALHEMYLAEQAPIVNALLQAALEPDSPANKSAPATVVASRAGPVASESHTQERQDGRIAL